MVYQDTQFGKGTVVFCGVVALVVVSLGVLLGAPLSELGLPLLMIAGVAYLFSSLTISVRPDCLQWWLSFGLLRGSVVLSKIRSARATRVRTVGFGIHFDLRGNAHWIVTGGQAIELVLASGRRITLGCNDPAKITEILSTFGVSILPS
ncbi:MAG: hypothetical protein NVSMB31_03840 [Vulcanimicrobiaceae bacterium]